MRVFCDIADIPDDARGSVVAIGNFDGVHQGHRSVIDEAVRAARAKSAPSGIMTFEPHPRTFFKPGNPVFRLTPEAAKLELMAALGVDQALVLPFTKDLSARDARTFVEDFLVDGLGVSHVVVGYDFQFGHGRDGNPGVLAALGDEFGFEVTAVAKFEAGDGEPVSSSKVRDCLKDGDVAGAARLLGYRWFVVSEIIHGDKRGRDLGYPTANMSLSADCQLRHGVYAVRMRVGDMVLQGVASYGRRPQFVAGPPLLETFIFDFSGDLYGEAAEVEFVGFLRAEEVFPSVEHLIAQMGRDTAQARAGLASMETEPFGPDALSKVA